VFRVLITIFVLFVLFSCGKGKREKRNYAGIVVDAAGVPVRQATVSIICRYGASSFHDGNEESCSHGITNEKGVFSFQLVHWTKETTSHFVVQSATNTIDFRDSTGASMTDMVIVLK
jgi:hypothetical protein